MRRTILLITLLSGAVLLLAQEVSDRVIPSTVFVVLAPTTVTDKNGDYVQGLKPSEFELYDNDKLQTIQVNESFAPISLVVAIQANSKVEGVLPKIQKMGALLAPMVAGDQGEVAILAYDHRIQKLQDFTNDTDKIEDAMKKLKPGSSSSAMVDAVEEASRMLNTRNKDRRRVILLISESRDNGSTGHIRETLTTTQVNNVMVYSLNISKIGAAFTSPTPYPRPDPVPPTARNVPGGGPQTPTSVAQMTGTQGYGMNFAPLLAEIFKSAKAVFVDDPLDVFTKYTGGKEFPFMSQKSLEHAVDEIGREIHNQYLISYNPNNKMEGGFHNIKVIVKRRGLDVRTRPGYWLAAVQ
jgi:VWFA-related protein